MSMIATYPPVTSATRELGDRMLMLLDEPIRPLADASLDTPSKPASYADYLSPFVSKMPQYRAALEAVIDGARKLGPEYLPIAQRTSDAVDGWLAFLNEMAVDKRVSTAGELGARMEPLVNERGSGLLDFASILGPPPSTMSSRPVN